VFMEARNDSRFGAVVLAAGTFVKYFSVAHSWKVFSRLRPKIPQTGIAASVVTVAYMPSRIGVSSICRMPNFCSPLGIKYAWLFPCGLLGRMLEYPASE